MTRAPLPDPEPPSNFVAVLRRRALEGPARPLYSVLDDGEAEGAPLDVGGLDRRARAVAAALRAAGLTGGERAVLLFPPGLEFVAGFFGCLYAGVVAVPTPPPRPNRPMPRLRAVADDARPAAVLTVAGPGAIDRARVLAEVPGLEGARWIETDAVADDLADDWRNPGVGPDDLAFLQYTSGSTGDPKGVMVAHRNLVHNSDLIRRRFGAGAESRGVFWLPPYHDMGLIGGLLQTLHCGGSSALMPPVAFLQRPLRWLRAISALGATISGGPNFAYDLCAR
ncbi:MAG TPA: AMP-binding protein, partial [Isosphaeraceae bacterium]|nr:AMP-binding protein [Isosphaeraceae bacterium]